jgi:pyruvate/2-oxoglutarate dehydrogenase complex dihydrolipoamide acyltransferase (E2) component
MTSEEIEARLLADEQWWERRARQWDARQRVIDARLRQIQASLDMLTEQSAAIADTLVEHRSDGHGA